MRVEAARAAELYLAGQLTSGSVWCGNMKHIQRKRLAYLCIFSILVIIARRIWWTSDEASNEDANLPEAWQRSPLWAEDQRPQLNPHRYRYMHNEPNFCGNEAIDLLILISSAVKHAEQREAIRQTWGDSAALEPYNTKVLFLLGQGSEKQSLVADESRMSGDIIQEDFKDSYSNLTLKTVMGLKWSSIFCPQAKYVMKTDDDIFVNVPLLHKALATTGGEEKNPFSGQISGCIKNAPNPAFQPIPHFDNKVEFEFLPPAHPAFTAGAGYIIAGNLVQDLYLASLSTRFFPVEDVFTTAHCAKRVGVHPPRHDNRFSCGEMVLKECQLKTMFTGHKVSPELQIVIWEAMQENKCP